MTKKLADRLKKGLALDNLRDAIDDFDAWTLQRPDVGAVIGGILKQIENRWTGHLLTPDEKREIEDIVVVRSLEILRKLDDEAEYAPLDDLRDLVRAYDVAKRGA